jgi:Outer membrane protein beta-barrel family
MRKKIALIPLLLVVSCTVFAQSNKGIITGKIIDSASRQALKFATITVFQASDTAMITYRLSDLDGAFKVSGIPLQLPCRVLVSFSGYHTYRHTFTLTEQNNKLDLGEIVLVGDPRAMDEVIVYAERPPITVRKDTIEFNAASFKTLPNALVEDLLKKMPGVQVDKDGNINFNGRKVSRLLVDSKAFFGDDPKMATRNLPANVIDKIQISDDKDALDANEGVKRADLPLVINLKLKKGVKKGWFGKATAGMGTGGRYEAGGIINTFRDTLQLSIIGFSNNVNRSSFTMSDIRDIGGFNRSGTNSMMSRSDGGFAINGISFGGTGEGIEQTTGAGFNLNYDLGKRLKFNAQYFLGSSVNTLAQENNSLQNFSDTLLNARNNRDEKTRGLSHRMGLRILFNPDTVNSFDFRPSLAIAHTRKNGLTTTNSFNNFKPKLNNSSNNLNSEGEDLAYTQTIRYNRSFRNKKRSFTITNYMDIKSNQLEQVNEAVNTFFANPIDQQTFLSQLRDRDNSNLNINTTVYYKQPLVNNHALIFTWENQFARDDNRVNTFDKDPFGNYTIVNTAFTNGLTRSIKRNTFTTRYNFSKGQLNFSVGMGWQKLNIDNRFVTANNRIKQNFNGWLPRLEVNWKNFTVNYSVNINQPNPDDLQPVANNTNPLYIILGNTDLVPGRTHNVYINYYKFNTKNKLNFFINGGGNIRQDAVVRERTVSATGVQTSRPINADGAYNFWLSGNINKEFIKNAKWQISGSTGLYGNIARNVLIVNGLRSFVSTINTYPGVSLNFNWNDVIEFNPSFNFPLSRTRYTDKSFQQQTVQTSDIRTELVIRWPKKIVWENSVSHRYNSQVAPGFPKTNTLWNASMSLLVMKNNQGQIKMTVFDILNQNVSFYRYAGENFVTDNRVNVLQRYAMLSFIYNIRKLGGKVGGRDRLFWF